MQDLIKAELEETYQTVGKVLQDEALLATIEAIANRCIHALRENRKLLFAGNGGSAADSQHLAAEFVSRFAFDRDALPAIALTTDTSALTAIGNDYGFEHLFSRQVQAIGAPGDILVGISTSGRSPNIINALRQAREIGLVTVGFGGGAPAAMGEHCDHLISVPSTKTARIQEAHIAIGHTICGMIENTLFRPK